LAFQVVTQTAEFSRNFVTLDGCDVLGNAGGFGFPAPELAAVIAATSSKYARFAL
jgi:hypothetical protein